LIREVYAMLFIPSRRCALALVLLVQSASLPAFAALGADVSTVAADGLKMKGMVHVSTAEAFSVHEIETPSGTLVREYVSPAGKVFGVAWRGPKMPDLAQTLGAYFKEYSEAPRSRPTDHKHFAIALPGLVMQSSARMHAYSGRAYVPELLPPNVSATDIK
jgi:Protein of unknown function (DUF2844)